MKTVIAAGAKPLPISPLMLVVIQSPRLGPLVPGVGGAQLQPSSAVATFRPTITVTAIAARADIKRG
jgi:hypothetical protein